MRVSFKNRPRKALRENMLFGSFLIGNLEIQAILRLVFVLIENVKKESIAKILVKSRNHEFEGYQSDLSIVNVSFVLAIASSDSHECLRDQKWLKSTFLRGYLQLSP